MLSSFPKIFALGSKFIEEILDGEVEITEKVDGSQFCFAKIGGELHFRSKGKTIFRDAPEKLFTRGVNYVCSIEDRLPEGIIFHGEFLAKPKHNVLTYGRTPTNHIILFSASDQGQQFFSHDSIQRWAEELGLESVPLIYKGQADTNKILELMDRESILGGVKIEGLVVKNYNKPFLLGGQPIPVMAGKYVSEAFKEVHNKTWAKENTARGKWESFKESYVTEARWEKAIQYLRDSGSLEGTPRDIGGVIKRVMQDIEEEEKETIKDFLWQEFGKEVLRHSVKGFPEYYKLRLLKGENVSL